ncbi:hypothetical protein B0H17DRAFT_1207166 [Mycena rosella]|uniref:Uncharacterized protein n=1 Tax=Mycena rosella TaxID=1033263 RepID=A0AAD7G8G5_MYCRO|nr:hypothetical protein B0H17DRAFT_1207166 [Mycena rosella]
MSADSPNLKQPFARPLFPPSPYSIEDVRATFLGAILTMHANFPNVLNDTLSLSDIKFRRTASQDTVCIFVDLDGLEHPSNPSGRPSTHGSLPFNAYDRMHALRDSPDNHGDELAGGERERGRAVPPTLGWLEWGHVDPNALFRVLKHPKDRESFMWDAAEIFGAVRAEFKPLVEAWLQPIWVLLSEARFSCRFLPEEEKSAKLDRVLTLNRVLDILQRKGDFDVRMAALIPVPADGSGEGV